MECDYPCKHQWSTAHTISVWGKINEDSKVEHQKAKRYCWKCKTTEGVSRSRLTNQITNTLQTSDWEAFLPEEEEQLRFLKPRPPTVTTVYRPGTTLGAPPVSSYASQRRELGLPGVPSQTPLLTNYSHNDRWWERNHFYNRGHNDCYDDHCDDSEEDDCERYSPCRGRERLRNRWNRIGAPRIREDYLGEGYETDPEEGEDGDNEEGEEKPFDLWGSDNGSTKDFFNIDLDKPKSPEQEEDEDIGRLWSGI